MRILFVQTNTYRLLSPTPLGAALVAARLARDGHDVRFVDLMHERRPAERAVAAAREHRPELVCYSVRNRDNMSSSAYLDPLPGIAALARAVREAWPAPALVGGTAFTTFPARVLDLLAAEWGIAGDDLEPISRFVGSVAHGAPDVETPGLVRRGDDGRIVENPFTIVGYGAVDVDYRFVDFGRYRGGYWQAGVITRSGCPERCTYCDTFHTFGRSFAPRDPERVAGELLALKRTGRVRRVFLVDAGFNRPLAHAKAVLREIVRRGAQLQLYAIHDPGEADEEFFELFRRAGGAMVMVFAESLSDRVLAEVRKPFGVAEIERDARLLRRAGIAFGFTPTFGGPGETPETVEETLARTPGLGAAFTEFSIGWRVQPRTELRERAVREGMIDASDDGFEPRFYVSRATPRPWLERRLASWRRRHPLAPLAILPFVARMMVHRPWTWTAEG
jgi:radical SAM superfamily enzyme YgiQ (UPF0313 family)